MAVAAGALMLVTVVTGAGAAPALAAPPGGGAVLEVDEQLDQATNVQVTPGRRAVVVSWTAPAGQAGDVDHYIATASDNVHSCETTLPGQTSCTIQSLVAGQNYTVTVVACPTTDDFELCSEPSDASGSVTPGPPAKPSQPVASYTGTGGQLQLDWNMSSLGAGVDSYRVTSPQRADFTCPGGGDTTPTCVVTGLTPGTEYAFQVIAVGVTNTVGGTLINTGASAASTASVGKVAGAPGAPGAPTVARLADGTSVRLNWVAPDAAAGIASYSVVSDPVVSPPAGCTNVNALTCDFTGLTAATSYTFQVRANGSNNSGNSPFSPASDAIVPGRPTAPTITTVAHNGAGAVDVTWSAPTLGAGDVSGYTVSSNPSVTPPVGCTNTVNTTCTFDGLTGGQQYTFTVVAHAPAGNSPASGASNAITAGPPGVPNQPTVELTGQTREVRVRWQTPANAGAGIAGYTVTRVGHTQDCDTPVTSNPAATSCIVTVPSDSTSYTFVVKAVGVGSSGNSANSAPSASIVAGPPGVAVQPTVQHNGANAVTVNWAAPVGGGPVTNYSVTSDPVVTPPAGCTNVDALTCNFTGLQGGQAYTFTVTANGPLGNTAAASPSASITAGPPGVPAAPTVALTGNTGEVQVSWVTPSAGAGIASYSVVSDPVVTPPVACTNDNASPCVFTGLDPTVQYRFKVKANGAVVGGQPTGDSAFSALSDPITAGAPGAPSKPTVTISGSGAVNVDWDAPTSGGPVGTYTVTSNPAVVDNDCVNIGATDCVFDGLTGGTAYTFTVTVTGTVGSPVASQPSDPITPGPPGAPAKPTVELTGQTGEVRVRWLTPANAGAGIGGFTVQSSPGNLNCDTPVTTTAGARDCIVTVPDTASYTFQVRTNGATVNGNASGNSSFSVASDAIVAAAPGQAAQPTVQHNGANAVTVNWAAPVSGGPVTSYSVTSDPAVTPPAGCTNVNALTCNFTGLQGGQAYTFTVTANGPLGNTAAASPSASITAGPPGVPAAPTVALTGNTGEVQVSWVAPNAGAGIASYSVVSEPASGPPAACTNDNASPCLFTGLDPTVQYRFKVKANGAVVGGQPTGDSAYSALSDPITPGVPGAPGAPTVTVTGDNTVRVEWDEPSTGGPVTSYTVTSNPAVTPPTGCIDTDALECDFGGLEDGETYTFTVTAHGPPGDSPASSPSDEVTIGDPAAPGAPSVVLGGANTVTVSWDVSSGGGEVTGYTVVASPEATAPAECFETLNDSCHFSGLDSGVEYTFSVIAHGLFGDTISASSEPITPGPPGAPSVPTVQLTDTAGEVRVIWDAPTLAGAGIDHYVVISTPEVDDPAGCTDVEPSDDTVECTFTGLDRDTAYRFQVLAVGVGNSGESEPSPQSEPITPNPSGAPGNVHVAAGDRQIAVSWSAPSNLGLGIDSYTARAYGQASREPVGSCGTDSTGTDCVITGLNNLASYQVIVFADGPGGTVQAPASAWVRPSAGVPGAPTAVRATPLDQSALIMWTAPTATGNGIARYTATATPGGQSCVTVNGTTTQCVIEGLNNGDTYTVTVVAVGTGASGNSSPSTPPVTVVPTVAPEAPTVTAVIPGASNLTVQFTPGDEGSGVNNYTATATGGPSTGPCTTVDPGVTPCVISGVRPGTSYTVTVVAHGVSVDSPPSSPFGPVTALAYAAPTLPGSLPPTSGALTSSAGTTLSGTTTVSGTGYAPYTGITVGIYPGPTVLGTAITDATGAFSLQVSVAGQSVGARTLVAAGMRSTGTVRYRNLAVTVRAPGAAGRSSLAATPAPTNGGSQPVVLTHAVPADGRNRTPSRG